MGGVLGRLFKVKKLELVLVGIENSCVYFASAHIQRLVESTRWARIQRPAGLISIMSSTDLAPR